MANIPQKTIKYPGLPNTYTFLQLDDTLSTAGKAADAKVVGDNLNRLNSQMATKAEQDGYYEEMTVGDAEQLVATKYVNEKTPYKYRTTGGSADVGNRAYVDKIVGGTVAWNQLFKYDTFSRSTTVSDVTLTDNRDGSYTLDGTANANGFVALSTQLLTPINHVLLMRGFKGATSGSAYMGFAGIGIDSGNGGIWKNTTAYSELNVRVDFSENTVFDNVTITPVYFDLTQMFGSTIADYIYSLEQATAGAGVAWFKSLFPKDYYAYNAGELLSVSGLQSRDTVGFNQWDEEYENKYIGADGTKGSLATAIASLNYIKVIPNTTYYIKSPASGTVVAYYDENKSFITRATDAENKTFTTPANCHYIQFSVYNYGSSAYKNDICINLSWSGTRNGEYEPYEKHSYALDDSLTLRGIPKLDAANKLYFDGDEYAPDGTVNRRYGIVDLGTLNWGPLSTYYFARLPQMSIANTWNTITAKYPRSAYINGQSLANEDKVFGIGLTSITTEYDVIFIKDTSYADAASLKASLNGVYCVYELATPTTEEAESYNPIQICDDWGTEEFVSGNIVPVGHDTRYPANLRDKVQHLPDLAANDGTYVIQQENSQMSLVPLTSVKELPDLQTTDGTYKLRCTVANGTPTLTWVSDT